MNEVTFAQLVGLDDSHLVSVPVGLGNSEALLARGAAEAFCLLADAARQAGIMLKVVSGHRNFERQLAIWNAKARGQRQVYSDRGLPIDALALEERERAFAILRWSALPGASRHHWGTDIDVCDEAAMPDAYQLQLNTAECEPDGVFHHLHCWLDHRIDEATSMGFVRPFALDSGGVAPEPWHLSFAPQAVHFEQRWDDDAYREFLARQPLDLKSAVLAHYDEIRERFLSCNLSERKGVVSSTQ